MTPDQVSEAERLIREGLDISAVPAALGVSQRTLERAWRRTHRTSPARWAREHAPRASRISPVVAFRLPEWDELVRAAEADGAEPNAWARDAVLRALAERGRGS